MNINHSFVDILVYHGEHKLASPMAIENNYSITSQPVTKQ